jgi:hypothetical protein
VKPPLRRLLVTLLIFVLIGPPIGGIMLFYGTGLPKVLSLRGLWMQTRQLLNAATLVFGMSYVLGTIPAAIAGLLVGFAQAFRGAVTWLEALVIGTLVGGGFVLTVFVLRPAGGDVHLLSLASAVLVLVCIASTLVCWAIVRAWYRFAPPAGGAAP